MKALLIDVAKQLENQASKPGQEPADVAKAKKVIAIIRDEQPKAKPRKKSKRG